MSDQHSDATQEQVKLGSLYTRSQHAGQVLSPLYAAQSRDSSEDNQDRGRHVEALQSSSHNLLERDHAVKSNMTGNAVDVGQSRDTVSDAEAAQTYPDTQLLQFADIELAHH